MKPIQSMTGFCSVEGEVGGQRMRLELKTLNHRFLDLKLRLPRNLGSVEMPLRGALQGAFSRGTLELKLDRIQEAGAEAEASAIQPNLEVAAQYHQALQALQKRLGLNDPIRTIDIAGMPEVISRSSAEIPSEEAWQQLEPLVRKGITQLTEMREHEGAALQKVLTEALAEMEAKLEILRQRRAECEGLYRSKIRDKIKTIFENYPVVGAGLPANAPHDASIQAVLESRIAQELSLLIDRTDVQEELVRFKGHIDHFRKVLKAGGPVGRKLDFILQELSREINTLGNKAQDLQISEEVVQIKVRLEQLREQVMNLE